MTRRWTAWFACFAILIASLAPSVSHALAATSNAGLSWFDICTTSAAKEDNASVKQAPASPGQHGMHFEHCLFCFTHAASFGLMPSTALLIPAVDGSHQLASLFYQSPRPLFIWASAQPRGPPSLS